MVDSFGGIEHLQYTEAERKMVDATFKNPDWYYDTNAHYPLIITAINEIESGKFNGSYNQLNESYVADQGVSMRSTCPVYLAIKTEVLALRSAVDQGVEKDFYISDLWQILQKIYDHTQCDPNLSKGAAVLSLPNTPYSYLLNEILSDFEDLTRRAVQYSVKQNKQEPENSKARMTGETLVRMWCLSLWETMGESDRIDPALLEQIVERYLRFMFALGWETSEIISSVGRNIPSLNAWRDLFLDEFKDCLRSPKQEHRTVLCRVFNNLDWGKPFISKGYDWLKIELDSSFFPQ